MNNYNIKYNRSNAVYENKDWDAWEKEWDRRKDTEFGKLLDKLNEIVFDYFGEYDDYGLKSTPISEIILEYFDGENNLIGLINSIKKVLENYDMMQEDDVRKIINRLNRIARSNKDRNLLESLVKKYGAKEVESAINRLNESINSSKLTQYIGGKMFINEIDFNNLPISSMVSVSNNCWKELFDVYGYSPIVTFKKIEKDVWKLVSVFKTSGIGKPSTYIKVNDGIEVSIKEILKHNVYSVSSKRYEINTINVNIPLYKDNGDMNVLYMYNGGQEFKYDSRFSLLKLLKAVENNDAYIKFSTTRQDGTIVINIHYGRNTYFLRCYESEFNDFCDKHDIYINKNNFNTYL